MSVRNSAFIIKRLVYLMLGIFIGLLFNNLFLSAAMSLIIWKLFRQADEMIEMKRKKNENEQFRVAMGIINGAYIQSNDIIKAVRENAERLPEAVKDIFLKFLVETNFIDSDIERAIERMREKSDNKFFKEWCGCLRQCQKDRKLKYILLTITEKMLDIKKIQEELDSMLFAVYKDFISVCVTALMSLPLMRVMNREWYVILTQSMTGRITVAAVYFAIGISCIYAFKINRPVFID